MIAVDEITDELKRTVTFLNRHTSSALRLLAVELRRAADAGVEVLTLESYGEESAGEKVGRPGPARLDRKTLLASIRERSELAADAADGILESADRRADRQPRVDVRYIPTSRVEFWVAGGKLLQIDRRAQIRVILQTLSEHGAPWDEERIEQLVQELADIGVLLESKRTWPNAPLEPLADETRRPRFLAVIERVLDTLNASA